MAKKLSASQVAEMQRLSESPAIGKIVDYVLKELDRSSLAELLSSLLYYRANGRSNLDYLMFVATWRFPKGLFLITELAAAAVPSMIVNGAFRNLVNQAIVPAAEST